jgi:hypothetical protein
MFVLLSPGFIILLAVVVRRFCDNNIHIYRGRGKGSHHGRGGGQGEFLFANRCGYPILVF